MVFPARLQQLLSEGRGRHNLVVVQVRKIEKQAVVGLALPITPACRYVAVNTRGLKPLLRRDFLAKYYPSRPDRCSQSRHLSIVEQ